MNVKHRSELRRGLKVCAFATGMLVLILGVVGWITDTAPGVLWLNGLLTVNPAALHDFSINATLK